MNMYELVCGHQAGDRELLQPGTPLMCPFGHGIVPIREIISEAQPTAIVNGRPPERSYGCSWGCGNPYDYIIISVAGGDTEFLCLVCYLKLAQDMIMAVLNPQDPAVRAAMNDTAGIESAPMTSGRIRPRGKNAPADIDDDDLIQAFDSRIISGESTEENS